MPNQAPISREDGRGIVNRHQPNELIVTFVADRDFMARLPHFPLLIN
jgi:hypothetical protein